VDKPVPVLYYLSGLTCTEQNVITKAGAQQHCAEHGIAFVCPGTWRAGGCERNTESQQWLCCAQPRAAARKTEGSKVIA
jgi:hypothetical protein